MGHEWMRNGFGVLAFAMTGAVIAMVLSPWVPDAKGGIANIVLGNVLGWPATVLAFYFGTTSSSAKKDSVIASMASNQGSEDYAN